MRNQKSPVAKNILQAITAIFENLEPQDREDLSVQTIEWEIVTLLYTGNCDFKLVETITKQLAENDLDIKFLAFKGLIDLVHERKNLFTRVNVVRATSTEIQYTDSSFLRYHHNSGFQAVYNL